MARRASRIAGFLLSFHGLLWTVTLAAMLFLWAYPLARNVWAYYTWDRVPCWHAPDGNHYFFERDGVSYYGDCHSFWDSLNLSVHLAADQGQNHPNDTICYVSRGNPMQAVDALDSIRHLERAMPRAGASVLLLVAVILLGSAASKHPGQPRNGAVP